MRRSILDDARTTLSRRPQSAAALHRRADRLAAFALGVERALRPDLHEPSQRPLIRAIRDGLGFPPIKD